MEFNSCSRLTRKFTISCIYYQVRIHAVYIIQGCVLEKKLFLFKIKEWCSRAREIEKKNPYTLIIINSFYFQWIIGRHDSVSIAKSTYLFLFQYFLPIPSILFCLVPIFFVSLHVLCCFLSYFSISIFHVSIGLSIFFSPAILKCKACFVTLNSRFLFRFHNIDSLFS